MKHVKRAMILIICLFMMTGCWNRREINQLVIAIALGIDKTENGYSFTAQLINPTMSSQATKKGGAGSMVRTVRSQGETLFEAWRNLTEINPRKVYFGHVQLVVLNEKLVEEGIQKSLDPLMRDHDFRSDFFLLVSKENTANDVLSILTVLEPIPALSIHSMLLSTSKHLGNISVLKFDELLEELNTEGMDLALTEIKVIGDVNNGKLVSNVEASAPETYVQVGTLALLKYDKLVGWFDKDQSKGLNYAKGNIKSTSEVLPCPNPNSGNQTVEIITTKANMSASIKNDTPKIEIEVEVKGNIVDVECEENPVDMKIFKQIEDALSSKIETMIKDAIKVSQEEVKSDVFGFGNTIHRKENGYWKKHKDQWYEIFPTIPYTVKVTAKLHNTGSLDHSVKEKDE
ncbi:Spore germination protein B3 precursor [Bacillus sp. THAF10]|uniref:Ger(x)C family spore germination protein n=1 Tax=Bacillus sp. THAF10 TaxID=2587848 RepID=UPI00126876E1|nr:Ger(x)C family spore germination protein [Bacillus sp. THAF10]QFT87634.1 Spore germination protein B3 precursor [Bacillus sp. THAF10]